MRKKLKISDTIVGTLLSLSTFLVSFLAAIIVCVIIWPDVDVLPPISLLILFLVPLGACIATIFLYRKTCLKKYAQQDLIDQLTSAQNKKSFNDIELAPSNVPDCPITPMEPSAPAKVPDCPIAPPEQKDIFTAAVDMVLETGHASVSMLQRRLRLGYAQAARIVDEMEERGIVAPFQGSVPRSVLVTREQWDGMQNISSAPPEPQNQKASTELEQAKKENDDLKAQLAALKAENRKLELSAAMSLQKDMEMKLTVAKAELLTIDLMEGHDFENWCADALKDSGFANVSVTPGSGDQGVDVVGEKDGIRYAFQCKRYNHDLGNTPIQEVFTGARFYNCHVGVVMTNRHFTSGAKDAATVTGVLLWDRQWILEYLYRKHGVMIAEAQ